MTPEDLLQSLKTSLDKLNPANLVQISVDGPHMNWKLLEEIVKDRIISDPEIPQLINVGSCGLHIVHEAFKTGAAATGWNTDNLLKSMWFVFSNSPNKERRLHESFNYGSTF